MTIFYTLARRVVTASTPTSILQPFTKRTFAAMTNTTIVNPPRDPNTLSNYNNWLTKHTSVDLVIDFKKQILHGTVTLQLESRTDKESKEIILDTSFVDVKEISINAEKTKDWEVKDRFEPYGSPLHIKVPSGAPLGTLVSVEIGLSTTDKCTALQWLTPAQTSNKKFPYMFSQCQAIHNRSIFPCQDTPDVKSTFDFKLRSPLPVLASGLPTGSRDFKHGEDGENGTLLYTFKQEVPIPAYLFAVASGDIATANIGPRSLVATGPEELLDAKWELENDMEKFLEAAEKLVNHYAWTQYNVLVLPASFP